MADNKNIDESAESLKEKTESLRKEIHDFANFQKFTLREFKRSESFKKIEKYTSLGSLIPESNRSVGADVARLLLGRFKEKKPLVELRDKDTGELIRDDKGNVKKVDPSDNSFKARLKRSGLTSFGRYISDDKEGVFYDILRTVAGRFGDDFIGKKKTLSAYEKQISELSPQEENRENASTEGFGDGEILTKIYENTEGIATALNVSNRKSEESTEEIINLSKKNVDIGVKSLDAQTKKNATDLEKELETKKTLEEAKDALKGIQKNVTNAVNLTTKSTGGASGEGGIIDNIADLTTIGALGKGIFGKVGGAFGSIFGKIKGFGTSTVGMLKYGAQVGTNKALPLLHSVKDSAKTVGANILEKGKGLLESGKSAINNIPTPKILDFAKKGGLIGAGITAISSIFDINKASDEIDEKVKSGVISKEDANRAKLNSAIEIGSKGAGGAIGGLVGMSKGAALGATLGSVVPVLGTGVGAVLGGLIGGFGGEKIGSWLGGFFGDSVTNDVKENKSFAERKQELKKERSKVETEEKILADKFLRENLDELVERGVIKKTEKDGIVSYEGLNGGAYEMSRARYNAEDSAFLKVNDKYEDITKREIALDKEIKLANLNPNNISPSNKNLEGAKMVNESEVANYKEKQRQAKSDKASDNVINNNVQTNVNNQTIQNRQLKPRSDHSIYERLHGSD